MDGRKQLGRPLRFMPLALPSPSRPSNFSPSSSLPPGPASPGASSLSKAGTLPAAWPPSLAPDPDPVVQCWERILGSRGPSPRGRCVGTAPGTDKPPSGKAAAPEQKGSGRGWTWRSGGSRDREGTSRGFTISAALCTAQRGLPGPGGALAVVPSPTSQCEELLSQGGR